MEPAEAADHRSSSRMAAPHLQPKLQVTRKTTAPVDAFLEAHEHRILSVKLFGLLVGCPAPTKIVGGIQNQSGFEPWRHLWKDLCPEQENRGLIRRRALLSSKFPSKEVVAGMGAKYAGEFGDEKAICDEDKSALLMAESPTALKQHIAMHASSLTAYDEVRQIDVSYLQIKSVWAPNASWQARRSRCHGNQQSWRERKLQRKRKERMKKVARASVGRKEKTTKRKTNAPFVGAQAIKSRAVGSTQKEKGKGPHLRCAISRSQKGAGKAAKDIFLVDAGATVSV